MKGSVESGKLVALQAELDELRRETDLRQAQLAQYAADLNATFKAERERAEALRQSYRATVKALANAVEVRDSYTAGHAERVAAYALLIAREAKLPIADSPEIEFGFLLHDVGKLGVPDGILFKEGALSPEERAVIERHPVVGAEILAGVEFLGAAGEVVRHHHERWDGDGYPDGLAGEAIPLAARVFAIADTFDALTSDRPYRPKSPITTARRVIAGGAGSQFDPALVNVFLGVDEAALDEIRTGAGAS